MKFQRGAISIRGARLPVHLVATHSVRQSLVSAPASAGAVTMMCDMAALHWNDYHAKHTQREWFLPYDGALAERIQRALPQTAPLLELGCGTSSLAAQLYDDGWHDITSIDISRRAVELASERHGGRSGLTFDVADARSLETFDEGSFGGVVDKGESPGSNQRLVLCLVGCRCAWLLCQLAAAARQTVDSLPPSSV